MPTSTLSRCDRTLRVVMRIMNRMHAGVKRLSGGRLARTWFGGSDLVLLTTIGRRTGRQRTVTLMSLRDGADFVRLGRA